MTIEPIWFCCNCSCVVNLDKHLRCASCGSDAVDSAVRKEGAIVPMAAREVETLERMFKAGDRV